MIRNKAVVLLSGGLDSTTVMAMARSEGYDLYSLSFNYGQRNKKELDSALKVSQAFGALQHRVMDVDLSKIGGSALTGHMEVPKGDAGRQIGRGIPATYVPARNTVFLSLALAWAEVLGAFDIFIGVNSVDYSGYPDCRPEYIEAFERLANLATRAGFEGRADFRIRAPVIHLKKHEIVKKGLELGVDFGMTNSCYDPFPGGEACGLCDSCVLRKKAFKDAGVIDPVRYRGGG